MGVGGRIGAGAVGILKRAWRRFLFSRAGNTQAIGKMLWSDLELLVGEAYRRQGYVVTERGGRQPDGGIDLELDGKGERVIVQCKQWKRPVQVQRVRELLGVVTGEGASRGILVAPGGFTADALAFARGKALQLWTIGNTPTQLFGGGGAVLTISPSGATVIDYGPSRDFLGTLDGGTVAYRIRGSVSSTLRAYPPDRLVEVMGSHDGTTQWFLNGQWEPRQSIQWTPSTGYSCSAFTLVESDSASSDTYTRG